jgi:hypothetical protein
MDAGKAKRGFMETISSQPADRQAQRMQANREELVERIKRSVPEDEVIQPLAGLYLARASVPRERVHSVVSPPFA